ncbi:B-cell receptor CD22-like [Polyodon spathula]|uniref:B-cell receptor CD22-like n=1 Tax=Polyodon spathula TaxID=7913 RepID=UPI001B7F5B1D|nr:B-cell receptor CD22-like [Polyodon spathula]
MGAAILGSTLAQVASVIILNEADETVQGGDWGVNYPPQEMCALRGSSVVIPCTYDYPELFHGTVLTVVTVKWFRTSIRDVADPGTYVYHSSGINVSPEYEHRTEYLGNKVKNCTLKISALQSSDRDRYYFRFETNNPSGKWTGRTGVSLSITELKVTLDPPVLYNNVREGSFVSLSCGFDRCNLSESSFVWYREGQPIKNEKSNKLQFIVSYERSGKYCCAAAENSSIKSEEFDLIVKYSPKNTSISVRAPGGIVEGSTVTLTCSSTANPPASSYTWFKGNQINVVNSGSEQNLIFANISLADSGEYYCESSNEIGRQKSPPMQIHVKYSPKNTSISVRAPGGIVEGSTVTLTCSSTANPPASSYTWFKGNQINVVNSGSEQNLIFANISLADSGEYYCESSNEIGRQKSPPMQIHVKYSPKNTSISVRAPGGIVEGSTVTLICSSTANPPASSYTWFKGNQINVVNSGSEQNLIFANISLADSGEYYCESSNEIGRQISPPMQIHVKYKTNIILVTIVAIQAAIIFALLVVICVKWFKSKSQEDSQNIQPSSGGDTYATIDLKTLSSDYDTLQVKHQADYK